MSAWLNQFQHIPDKDVVFVGLLDQKTDDFNKTSWVPQIEGSKTTVELPGILDEVISMVPYKSGELEENLFVRHSTAEDFQQKIAVGNCRSLKKRI